MASANPNSHRRTITLSTVVSVLAICGVILPLVGVIGSPWLIGFLSTAVGGEIQIQVREQTAPFNAAMKVLLESQIVTMEDEIESMKFRRDRSNADWTEADNRDLTAKLRRLQAHRAALAAMDQAQPRPH